MSTNIAEGEKAVVDRSTWRAFKVVNRLLVGGGGSEGKREGTRGGVYKGQANILV